MLLLLLSFCSSTFDSLSHVAFFGFLLLQSVSLCRGSTDKQVAAPSCITSTLWSMAGNGVSVRVEWMKSLTSSSSWSSVLLSLFYFQIQDSKVMLEQTKTRRHCLRRELMAEKIIQIQNFQNCHYSERYGSRAGGVMMVDGLIQNSKSFKFKTPNIQ